MVKASSCVLAVLLSGMATLAAAQTADFKPVTDEMLANPSPNDWLMINRTYDEQRFSPLDQINKQNVGGLQLAWSRGLPLGTSETTPIVHDGVIYAVSPGAGVIALNATNGDFIWEYTREYPKDMTDFIGSAAAARSKGLAIYQDMIYFLAPMARSSRSTRRPARSAGRTSSRITRSCRRTPPRRSSSTAR